MKPNPYLAPAAVAESAVVSRPRSVWIVQFLFGIMLLSTVLGLLRTAIAATSGLVSPAYATGSGIAYVLMFFLVALGMRSIHRGKPGGRIAGCLAITLFEVASLLNFGNTARAFAGVGAADAIFTLLLTGVVMLLPLPLLAYHFGFTDKARRYFGLNRSTAADWLNPRR